MRSHLFRALVVGVPILLARSSHAQETRSSTLFTTEHSLDLERIGSPSAERRRPPDGGLQSYSPEAFLRFVRATLSFSFFFPRRIGTISGSASRSAIVV